MKICSKCNETHQKPGIFCSRSCANYRGKRSNETKEKIKYWALNNPRGWALNGLSKETIQQKSEKRKQKTHFWKQCPECNNSFYSRISDNRIFCSRPCFDKNNGGHRQGSGRGKKGWYKGFFCDSTWELAFVFYHLEHSIPIERNNAYYEYLDPNTEKIKKYYPDFRSNGSLVEIKGYKSDIDDIKLASVTEPIKIYYKNDLKEIFDFVSKTSGLKIENLYQIYEN